LIVEARVRVPEPVLVKVPVVPVSSPEKTVLSALPAVSWPVPMAISPEPAMEATVSAWPLRSRRPSLAKTRAAVLMI
jgi:hypothetical protein